MHCVAEPKPQLIALGGASLPGWCDAYLAAPGGADFFGGRLWYETMLAHALPRDAAPMLAVAGGLMLPLLWHEGRLRSLVTPYSLEWRPLAATDVPAEALRLAGRALAGMLRGHPPTRLDAMDPDAPGLLEMLDGMRAAGLAQAPYRHFGNWWHAVEGGWADYFASRPPELRTTITRKLARAAREASLTLHDEPGAELERAIIAYTTVRAKSWKPAEPFPDFDAALLRATAAAGLLRMGVLWRADGTPLAAQYWVVGGGRASLLKLVHDETARAASPGTVLTAMMIRHVIERDDVAELDFGRGDDPYKRLWASGRRQRIGVMLTDPWHPAGLLELARQAAARGRRLLMGAPTPAGATAP